MTADEIFRLIQASDKPYYVYELRRPDTTPFYVGAGQGKRVFHHEKQARESRRGHKHSLVRKILREGEQIDYQIVGFFATWEEAAKEEMRLIAHYGRRDNGTGFLLNLTDGGDGVIGIKWEFTPARQAGSKRAADKLRGRKASAETREKIGQTWRGRKQSPDHIEKRMANLRGRSPSAATREKQSASAKQRSSQPFIDGARQWREQNMDQLIAERQSRWKDPEKHQRMAQANELEHGKPVIAAGISYPSISAASRATGLSRYEISKLIDQGEPGYSRLKK